MLWVDVETYLHSNDKETVTKDKEQRLHKSHIEQIFDKSNEIDVESD
jgi:hypothetical protein